MHIEEKQMLIVLMRYGLIPVSLLRLFRTFERGYELKEEIASMKWKKFINPLTQIKQV